MAVALLALLGAVIGFVVIRRVKRDCESRLGNQTRRLCEEALHGLLTAEIQHLDALARLRRLPKAQVRASFESILREDKEPSPERAAALRKLCEDLGLVALWRRRLAARRSTRGASRLIDYLYVWRRRGPLNFVLRAEAAENLGIICDQSSWPLLVDALDDPNGAVRSAAVRNLARIREPRGFAALADRLELAARDSAPEISARCLKMALASFPLMQAARLRQPLEHPHPRVRLLASEVVFLMVQREAAEGGDPGFNCEHLPAEVAEIFLTRLARDHDPDVRARAADVVARLEPFCALPVLTPLLGDSAWFVRLHAVRALRHQRTAPLALLSQRLTDPHWRVREAAARTLFTRGRSGVRRLFEHFLTTDDRYSQEQVAEQIERGGLVAFALENYGESGRELETRVVEAMVLRGFGDILLPALRNGTPPEKSRALVQELSRSSNANADLFMRQWVGSASTEREIPERPLADKSRPAGLEPDRLAPVEVS